MDVSIVIVSWNVRDLLRRCVMSVASQQSTVNSEKANLATGDWRLTTEVIIVDNASTDGSVAMLRESFPDARVIANAQNRGFTRANNQGFALARGRYLFALNPDTGLTPGALEAMLAFMDAHPRVGMVGPQLLYPDGSIQSSRRRFPTLATAFFESTKLQQWFPRNRLLARYYVQDTRDDEIQSVDWIVGAAMFIRREVYEQIGGFDEDFFMYSEELDWCYRAKKAGWDVVYFPRAQIIHHEGKSSEQVLAARDIYFHSSKIRFFRKHHGALPALLLRAFLLLMFAYQLAEESAKWLVGHKRALRAARVRGYWQVLKSGVK
jgi:GT2 family glycosyltransferase